jgi:hypothetical protein
VKVKANMQFKKIFEVAEVCRNVLPIYRAAQLICMAETIWKRSRYARPHICGLTRRERRPLTRLGTLRFVYDGERLSPTDTPAEVRCLPFTFLRS